MRGEYKIAEEGYVKNVPLLEYPFDPGGIFVLVGDKHEGMCQLLMTYFAFFSPQREVKTINFNLVIALPLSRLEYDLLFHVLTICSKTHDFYLNVVPRVFVCESLKMDGKSGESLRRNGFLLKPSDSGKPCCNICPGIARKRDSQLSYFLNGPCRLIEQVCLYLFGVEEGSGEVQNVHGSGVYQP